MLDFIINTETQKSLLDTQFISILLGGGVTLAGVWLTDFFNQKTTKYKERQEEINVVLSILDELTTLKEFYEEEMDETYLNLPENKYAKNYYTLTQDFMTVYHNNAVNIGKITNRKTSQLIIKTYTNIKKFIEESIIYEKKLKQCYAERQRFLRLIFPNLLMENLSDDSVDIEMENIIKIVKQNNWECFINSPFNNVQIKFFLSRDENNIAGLVYYSRKLQTSYRQLKNNIIFTIELIQQIYIEDNNERK